MTKSIVKRGVTELVTPGVALSDQILRSRQYKQLPLRSVHFGTTVTLGVAFVRHLAPESFIAAQGSAMQYIEKARVLALRRARLYFERSKRATSIRQVFRINYHTYHLEDWAFQQPVYADDTLNAAISDSLPQRFWSRGPSRGSYCCRCNAIHYLS